MPHLVQSPNLILDVAVVLGLCRWQFVVCSTVTNRGVHEPRACYGCCHILAAVCLLIPAASQICVEWCPRFTETAETTVKLL
jgi:hypothetical protein